MRILIIAMLAVLFGSGEASGISGGEAKWKTINPQDGYRAESKGDAQEEGAHVTVHSISDATGKYGGAISQLDAAHFRKLRVILSSNIRASAGTSGAAIWIRADGATGKLQFVTSARFPVLGGQGAQFREISLLVPPEAERLVYGVVMNGNGEVDATEIRLRTELPAESKTTATEVLESALKIVQSNALNADAIDWETQSGNIRDAARGARTPEEVYPAIRRMLSMLGDGHSFHLDPDTARQHELMAAPSSVPIVKLLGNNVGYVLMPGFAGRNDEEGRRFSKAVIVQIQSIAPKATAGWIVDLRENTGGNMWPMLAALKPLLGAGPLGSFRGRDGELRHWAASGDYSNVDLAGAKVAVLLGTKTSSSGEAVAIAFHGRPQTRSFGAPTAGQSTSNSTFTLPDGSQILLTTAVDVDRNGVVFGGVLKPDELVESAEGQHDPAVETALGWLLRPISQATSP